MSYISEVSPLTAALGLVMLLLLVYAVGWAFSSGFHRAKRVYVDKLTRDSCKEEN